MLPGLVEPSLKGKKRPNHPRSPGLQLPTVGSAVQDLVGDAETLVGPSAPEHGRDEHEARRLDLGAPAPSSTGILNCAAERLAHLVPLRPQPERRREDKPGPRQAFVVVAALQHRDRLARQLLLLIGPRLLPGEVREERELETGTNPQVLPIELVRLGERFFEHDPTPLEVVAGLTETPTEVEQNQKMLRVGLARKAGRALEQVRGRPPVAAFVSPASCARQ